MFADPDLHPRWPPLCNHLANLKQALHKCSLDALFSNDVHWFQSTSQMTAAENKDLTWNPMRKLLKNIPL